ncbi:HvfX family Cu-binding RiPP maturation protein [Psychrosphaera aestuarii]|uniref:HvfX family Cu-binding RiPP maturation protein n=1 Tax=Psychrosphaera aestuarii TaxID=1266052 RepID=UPI001B328531|nr:DoxX family protein [Psychrosphaera aestuarii]
MKKIFNYYERWVAKMEHLDGIPPLLIRLYLSPIFIQAGWNKLINFDSTVAWFANPDWGLGLPFPELLAGMAAGTEFIGGWLILVGLATRIIAIPLAFTMAVAALTVHWDNGWLAIADASSWMADGTIILNESVLAATAKKEAAITILQEHGNYEWLTSSGSFTILNNGIEFAVTYFVMVLVLLFAGAGRYTSIDYYIHKSMAQQIS